MDGSDDATESSATTTHGLYGTVSNLAKVVGTVAPLVASGLSGGAASVILGLLGLTFGLHQGSVSDLIAKIQTDPEMAYKLRKLESDHAEFLAGIDSKNLEIESTDREDARKYSETYKAFLIQISFIVTAGFFGILLLLFVPLDISDEGKNLLSMLVGMLASKWQTIIDFFFGSSHSHDVKVKL